MIMTAASPFEAKHYYVVRLKDATGEHDTIYIGPFEQARDAHAYADLVEQVESKTVDAYVESVTSPRSPST
jgi:hypothetical protein